MKKMHVSIILFILFGFVFNDIALSWDNKITHMQLSEYAADNSVLDKNKGNYLKNLGFDNALDTGFKWGIKKSIKIWLKEGAQLEDAGSDLDALTGRARYVNHFHDPTKEWNSAGLTDLQFRNGESSILWAQDSLKQETFIEGDWSWNKIRQVYYWALISPTEAQRQINFAQTFKGLGYQMHLIQDMAQPSHVRNDAHPLDGKGWMDGLETWTKSKKATVNSFAASPQFPQVNLSVDIVYEGNNYSPITQLVDTVQSAGTIIPSTSLEQGLSEYTNSNFVSDDTVFTEDIHPDYDHYFPYPRYSSESYEMYEIELPYLRKRIYLRKTGDGEKVEHFATAGPLFKWLDFDPELQRGALKLDPAVHHDYAKKLIPRAVGYSAGLLNYFFRGDINLEFDLDAVNGYVILNNTEEEMDGTFEVYYDDIYDQRQLLWSGDLFIPAKGKSASISFNIPSYPKESGKYILVFTGRIGSEYDAVAGKVVVMPDMELRRVHFLVFRDNNSKLRDNDTGLIKTVTGPQPNGYFNTTDTIGDDKTGYYNTQSVVMMTAAQRTVPEDWGYPDNTMYYWKFRNVSGQAKLVQEGTEPGERRLYHRAVVNVDGTSFTVNRIERSNERDYFVTHFYDIYWNSPSFIYHTGDPLNEAYWNDGYDAIEGQCDSLAIFINPYWYPGRSKNIIQIYNDKTYSLLGNIDYPWFAFNFRVEGNDHWRALSALENNADWVELYSAHAPMYPPDPF